MKKVYIPLFSYLFLLLAFSSCRQDEASPIRNVKAGPKLLRAEAAGGSCANYTYYLADEQVSLGNVYTKQVLVAFIDGLSAEDEAETVAAYGFVERMSGQISSNSALLHNLELSEGLNCQEVERAIALLAGDPNIAYVAPYFMSGNGLLGVSNEAIVTVAKGREAVLERMASAYKAEVLMPLSGQTYLVRVDKNSKGNALELANFLKDKKDIVHAEPDFVVSLEEEAAPLVEQREGRTGYLR